MWNYDELYVTNESCYMLPLTESLLWFDFEDSARGVVAFVDPVNVTVLF